MDQNAKVEGKSFVRRLLTIGGLVGLGAVGWYVIELAIRDHHDNRPPIIVQGGSAQIEVQFADAKHGKKGEWKQRGSSGIWDHQHPAEKPTKLYNTVFPTMGCTDYEYLCTRDLTVTLRSEADASKTWQFDIRIDGNHLAVVLPNPKDFSVTQPDASKLVIEAQIQPDSTKPPVKVDTDLVAVHARGEPGKNCTFMGVVSFIQLIQKQ